MNGLPVPSPYNAATGGVRSRAPRTEQPRDPWPGEDNASYEALQCPKCAEWGTLYKRRDGAPALCSVCDPAYGA